MTTFEAILASGCMNANIWFINQKFVFGIMGNLRYRFSFSHYFSSTDAHRFPCIFVLTEANVDYQWLSDAFEKL
jgi:hypothetical protein